MTVMYAASREALAQCKKLALELITASAQPIVAGQQMGVELFSIVEQIEADRPTRIALADVSVTPQRRVNLLTQLLSGKVMDETLQVCQAAVAAEWSNPADLRDGLVRIGRTALLCAARDSGTLGQVEEELFRLSRIVKDNPALEQALGMQRATVDERRALLAQFLYGKVSAITEILASQAVARPQQGLVADDLDVLSRQAAHESGHRVADVTVPVALSDAQRDNLRRQLRDVYGVDLSIHEVVDPSIIGGVIVRVGNEIVNGSLTSKLEALRRSLV